MAFSVGLITLVLAVAAVRPQPKPVPRVDVNPAPAALGQAKPRQPNPKSESDWVEEGNRLMQMARSTQADSDYRRAEAAYDQALSINPASSTAMTGMAWVNGARHDFEQSIDWAQKAIAKQPESPETYGLWGDALVEMGDYDGAFEKYQRMMDLRPDLSSYSRGAHLLDLTGDRDRAIFLMQKAIAAGGPHAENIAWCQAQLALMLLSQGDYEKAETLLKASLDKTPGNYHLIDAMAKVKTALKNYPAAIVYLEEATGMVPQPAAICDLGDLYLLVGRKHDADRQFELAEAIFRMKQQAGQKADIQLARFYADHDRNLARALAEAEAVYRMRKNILVADTLAWCYYKNSRYEDARRLIEEALRFHTADARIFYHAGMIHARLGHQDLARRYLNSALALSPHFHPAFAARAVETLNHLNPRG
jgi:tetratricopeptide (TPR) repeat protein